MTSSPDVATTDALALLEELGARLSQVGWQTRLHAPPDRRPMLHVANPAVTVLSEFVTVEQDRSGQWWYWWSWAERISPVDDLARAATVVGRVLASHAPGR